MNKQTDERVEHTLTGNREFIASVIDDLLQAFPNKGYTPSKSIESIMYEEGSLRVVEYLRRKYLEQRNV